MIQQEQLGAYLTDHLAGSSAGMELAERLRANNEGSPFGDVLAKVAKDIKDDRATLESLIGRLGIAVNPVKQAAGWGFEKLSRLRMGRLMTGSEGLTRLLEMETLGLGIEGKLLMWKALKEVAKLDERLATTNFDQLVDRAARQREALEPYRLQAAAEAFSA